MDITNEILRQLQEFSLSASEEILLKMKEFCFAYNCTAEHIVDTWVAFSTTKKGDMQPTLGMLDHMEKEVLMKNSNKSTKNRKSVTTPVYNSATIDLIKLAEIKSTETNSHPLICKSTSVYGTLSIMHSDDHYDISDKSNKRNSASVMKSPVIFSPNSLTPTRFTPSRKFASRTGAGEVVCSFGDTQNVIWKLSDEFSCSIIPYNEKTALQDSYHFMCEKLRDRASILNDMIQDAAQYFEGKYDIHEWGHIQLPSVETVPVIGRVCSDGSGRLNASSLLLEGSQEMCSGAMIPLDVSRLESFSLFPGQIIAGTGINNLGKKIILSNMYEGIFPLPSPEAPDLANCFDSLSVIVAAGPFATSDSLSYEPLNDLMKYVKINLPHVVILIGPLVDVNNDLIEKGDLNETYDELFQNLIVEILKHIESLSTKVVLVPSIKDAHHDFVYPTPPYKTKMLTKRLFLASDPCIINIEGVLFGLTSVDVLFHLGKEEISFPQLPDRLGRLCSHLLTQRNFYPLYPPSEDINIDYLHFELHSGLPVMPHVLILPSDLRYFIKDINGCCCINPERLTKRSAGGTFARIKIKKVDEKSYDGSIIDSLLVEIVKI